MYIVARMILGFGIPCCIVAGSSLIGELGYPKERPVLTSLFNVAYFVGKTSSSSNGMMMLTKVRSNHCCWHHLWHQQHQQQLGMENPFSASDHAFASTDWLCLLPSRKPS